MSGRVPIYVAHPLNAPTAAERDANRARAARWVAWLADRYLVAPGADWILLAGEWPETPERRATGLEIDRRLVELCGTIVLVGPRVSDGMRFESSWARTVVDLTDLTECQYPGIECNELVCIDNWYECDARMAAAGIAKADA